MPNLNYFYAKDIQTQIETKNRKENYFYGLWKRYVSFW